MLLPPFSGQQLLCKGINETGGARQRQPGRDWGGEEVVAGLRWGAGGLEMGCAVPLPAVSLWKGVFRGYVTGKSMTFCLIFEDMEHVPPNQSQPPSESATKRPHRSETGLVFICFVSVSQVPHRDGVSGQWSHSFPLNAAFPESCFADAGAGGRASMTSPNKKARFLAPVLYLQSPATGYGGLPSLLRTICRNSVAK